MKTLTKLMTLSIVLLITTSCFIDGFTGIKGNGHVVSESRTINASFEGIKVQQGIKVYLTQGNTSSLNVEADENIIDLLLTEVKNNELRIFFKKNVYKAKSRTVYLTTPNIVSIKASSGASVKSENTLQVADLTLDASSGSSIKATVNATKVDCSTSSGANIRLYGNTQILFASSSSGSRIDAEELKAVDVTAKVSSGANIDVFVTGKLTARASSGGDIDYSGNPENIDKDTSSGGSVSRS